MHRAAQILDAIVARLRASTTLGINAQNIFPHRTLSLAEMQDELPAITVKFGDEEAAEQYTRLDGEIGRALSILTKAYVTGDDELTVTDELTAIRTETHKAINLLQTLGLSFVFKVGYGSAPAPEIDFEGERCAGSQESQWLVLYYLNPSDPS